MRSYRRIVLGLLVTALLSATFAGAAAAKRFELSNQQIRADWSGPEQSAELLNIDGVRCNATMEGSFHSRTIAKVSGALVGFITRAIMMRNCDFEEHAWFFNGSEFDCEDPTTLPWHVRYDSFIGALPRISSIRLQIIGLAVLTAGTFSYCDWRSTAAKPAFVTLSVDARGIITSFNAATSEIPLVIELIETTCVTRSNWSGEAALTVLGTTTAITARLVQ